MSSGAEVPAGTTIRAVLGEHGGLAVDAAAVGDHDDLYEAGLTSFASVNVMLALEDAFDTEFPDDLLQRSTFQTVASIASALGLDVAAG